MVRSVATRSPKIGRRRPPDASAPEMTKASPSPTTAPAFSDAEPAGPEGLIRRLVERTAMITADRQAAREPPGGDAADAPVLLDIEVDGVRCVLVRARHNSRPPLSPREQEIARMVAKGLPNKVIADVLQISCWTVGTHLRRIFAKVGVSTRAAMVAKILEEPQGGAR